MTQDPSDYTTSIGKFFLCLKTGSERAHYRGLGWSQIISFKWDGKETVVRPDAPPR